MAKVKNLSIYGKTAEQFRVLKEEYDSIGFSTKLLDDRLIIFARHPKKPVAKKVVKRREGAEHHSERREQRPKVEKIVG